MAKINRKCIICGESYSFCPVCNSGDANKPTWYFIFDSLNCHDIYDVCTKYRDNEINEEEAYDLISKLDLSNIKNFVQSTRLQIEEIMKLHKESNKSKKEIVSEATVVKEEKNETSQEFHIDTNKYYKKK